MRVVIQHLVNYVGIAVLATSGAVVGVRKGFDLFGIATLAVLSGIGGVVLRDMLLDLAPPASIQHWQDITVCLAASALTTVFAKWVIQLNQLNWLDCMGSLDWSSPDCLFDSFGLAGSAGLAG